MQTRRSQLGKRIRELRKSYGWSQEVLSEKAGPHPTYIGGIGRGERNVGFDNLARLPDAFDLSLAEVFDFPRQGAIRGGPDESGVDRATGGSKGNRLEIPFVDCCHL
jgi:transcriptional regulator with XRE-family HTH domain